MHKNYSDFFDAEKTVKYFISIVENKFVSRGKVKVQGSAEIINYQPAYKINQLIELERRRTWSTDVYTCIYFNAHVKREISKNFKKTMTFMVGSSWHFKRFECLSVIVTSVNDSFALI